MRFAVVMFLFAVTALGQTLFDPAITMSDSPLRRGLVGYWRLEEASGTRYDCSKNGNHLTSNNSVGQTNGIQQNCSSFVSASSQYLSLTSNSSVQAGDVFFCVSAWAYTLSTNLQKAIVSKFDSSVNKREYLLYLDADNKFKFLVNAVGDSGNSIICTNSTTAVTNTWYFVVGYHDPNANTIGCSVNGSAFATTSTSAGILASTSIFAIGAIQPAGSAFWNGRIDEVGIWKNRSMSASDITFLYQSGRGTHFPWAHP